MVLTEKDKASCAACARRLVVTLTDKQREWLQRCEYEELIAVSAAVITTQLLLATLDLSEEENKAIRSALNMEPQSVHNNPALLVALAKELYELLQQMKGTVQ